ncbi:MAG: N-6 DNA methylase [Gemmatimonadota bacterium]
MSQTRKSRKKRPDAGSNTHTVATAAQPAPAVTVEGILRGTAHALTIFRPATIAGLKIFLKRGRPYLTCYASGKERPAKPEEIVRQLFLKMLMDDYGYPAGRIAIEKPVQMGSNVHDKPADIVIWDKDDPTAAYIIVECKKPRRSDGLEQLKSYCNAEGSPIGVWTNGGETIHLHRRNPNYYQNLPDIPLASQTLSELLDERWTLHDLAEHNVLVKEQTTLKNIILDMENLVLANAGVDAFEEVFKLIYAKLYDEAQAAQGGKQKRYLQFRVGGATPSEFKQRINDLFDKAKAKWPGVFLEGERIDLTPEHLVTCGSYLENVKLFNSNLQVIDEAFEYLSVEVGKAKKGQYFTPRHVIDMAVKMLNPLIEEYVIDTAAGSCGFTVHSIFHVWGHEFTADGPAKWQSDYANSMVYAIDFDPRSIKIAKALNLIAGDGRTNVYRANSLDPRGWSDEVKVGLRDRLQRFPNDPQKDRWNREHYRYFDFDVLLTNPPFAGDITDSRILHQFDLAKKANGKWQNKVGRDVLFIQRNLEFLKPGGRMAIVLPQGRLNNTTDKIIRDFIAHHARILAVVGLHVNTFKPHTGTKTSILFVQKWNDHPDAPPALRCPKAEDYPIFFATSQQGGKDTSGEYVYLTDDKGRRLYDLHAHPMVDHDLYNLRNYLADQLEQRLGAAKTGTEKQTIRDAHAAKLPFVPDRLGIADAFRDWGRNQGFGFCDDEGRE